jgi:hypothetical protein
MNLKTVSIVLLFLFSIVIAFPGYGSSARIIKTQTGIQAVEDTDFFSNMVLVLKKCLSKGINMIEEERNSEEDEAGSAVVFEYFAYSFAAAIATKQAQLYAYHTPYYQTTSLTIYTPPDCFS